MPRSTVRRWCLAADLVIAADGAVDRLPLHLHKPAVVVGDLDSASKAGARSSEAVIHNPEQSSTDCEKALNVVFSHYKMSEIAIISHEGDYFDHVLASTFAVADANLSSLIGLRRGVAIAVQPGPMRRFRTSPGFRVSLLPLERCNGVNLNGVEWPLTESELALGRLVSVSNRATGRELSVGIESGVALLILETNGDPMWPSDLQIG